MEEPDNPAVRRVNYAIIVDLSGEVLGFRSEPVPIHDTDTMVQYIQDRRCA